MAAVAASPAFVGRVNSSGKKNALTRKLAVRRRATDATSRAAVVVASATPAEESNIVVLGGTGGTGSECVVQALKRGAKVTVLARDPSKMVQPPGSGGAAEGQPLSDPNLTVVQGNVTSAADVAKVITADTTGVVIALGGKTKDVGKTMLTEGSLNVINAMKDAGVKRVAVVTSIGAGDSADQAPFVFKILMSTVMRSIFNDKNNQEQLFLGPGGPGRDLEFCIVRPGGEEPSPPTKIEKESLRWCVVYIFFVILFPPSPPFANLGRDGGRHNVRSCVRVSVSTPPTRAFTDSLAYALHALLLIRNRSIESQPRPPLPPPLLRGLGTGPPTGVVNVIDGEAGSISRADVADFCLGALFQEVFPYLGKAPCISSVGGTSWTKDRGGKGVMEA